MSVRNQALAYNPYTSYDLRRRWACDCPTPSERIPIPQNMRQANCATLIPMERRNYFLKFSLLLLLAISLGACNLGTAREAAPPTLQALPHRLTHRRLPAELTT